MTTAIEQTVETYGIENWGAGYFDVNRKGNLIVRPAEPAWSCDFLFRRARGRGRLFHDESG